jgi:hypothetical protein
MTSVRHLCYRKETTPCDSERAVAWFVMYQAALDHSGRLVATRRPIPDLQRRMGCNLFVGTRFRPNNRPDKVTRFNYCPFAREEYRPFIEATVRAACDGKVKLLPATSPSPDTKKKVPAPAGIVFLIPAAYGVAARLLPILPLYFHYHKTT